ncbi:MAG: GAF domain-containing sensor histidine kinase [Acidimicrobiia bacterium]|nr:GAF domain-containing sensor histidine kinase [Acidimicrobiia bacterium]
MDNSVDSIEREFTLRQEEAERLFRISARVNAGVSVEDILNTVFEEFRPILPYDRMEYTHVEAEGRRLRTAWVRTTYEPVLLRVGHIVEPATPIGEILDPGLAPFLENDVETYALRRPGGHPASYLAAEGIRAVMSVPMVVDDEVIGMLFIASRSQTFGDRQVQLIRYVGSQIAGAIAQSRLREVLEERNDELELVHRQRSAFIAAISHELRNPLTSVVGLSATLRDSIGKLATDEAQELAGILARESIEVAGIVDDLLTVARQDAGHLEVEPVAIDLRTEVDQIVEVWQGPGHSLDVAGVSAPAYADPLRVRQILRNLVSNAFKYGGEHIAIEVGSGVDFATVEVSDDGPGVPEADRERIFEVYGTAASSSRRGEAVGLGLAVARQLAEAMAGDLSYRFEGGLSRFLLRLPTSG